MRQIDAQVALCLKTMYGVECYVSLGNMFGRRAGLCLTCRCDASKLDSGDGFEMEDYRVEVSRRFSLLELDSMVQGVVAEDNQIATGNCSLVQLVDHR